MLLPELHDNVQYVVAVKRPIKHGVITMLPRDTHEVSGAFLKALIQEHTEDAIRSAEPR